MRTRKSAAITGLLFMVGSAFAFNEPDGLQILKFGQDVREILPKCDTLASAEKYTNPCWRQHDSWAADESKLNVDNLVIGETRLRDVQVEMIDYKLEYIKGTFVGARFPEITEAMIARYGKPTLSGTNEYQNAFGMKRKYPAYQWSGKKVTVHLMEMPLNTRETIGYFSFQTAKHDAVERANKASRTEKAAKGL